MSRAFVVRPLSPTAALVVAALMLTACSAGTLNPGGGSAFPPLASSGPPASLETQRACRQRTNEIFEKRSRPEIYAAHSSLNSPFSGTYLPDAPIGGLSGQFAYERAAAECERSAGTGSERTDTTPAAPAQARPRAAVR